MAFMSPMQAANYAASPETALSSVSKRKGPSTYDIQFFGRLVGSYKLNIRMLPGHLSQYI